MINYLVTKRHTYTIDPPTGWPANPLIDLLRPLPYESISRLQRFAAGCYIFSDVERLTGGLLKLARHFHQTLKSDPHCIVLNDPSKSLKRLRLLQTLESVGINPFKARPLHEHRGLRYPVFIREANEHSGPRTPLLHSADQVEDAARQLLMKGFKARDLIVVEFVDTSDEHGRFKKYGMVRVGDRMIARHIFFSTSWEMKSASMITDDTVQEELSFVQSNPHEDVIRSIFDLAGIEYGRIDYAMLDGRPVIWEINTNPMLGQSPRQVGPDESLRTTVVSITNDGVGTAFREIDAKVRQQGESIPFHVPRSWGWRVATEQILLDADKRRRELTAKANWKLHRTRR